jgi:hypothetical protein
MNNENLNSFLFMSRGPFFSKKRNPIISKRSDKKKSSFSGSDPAKLTESLFTEK